MTRRQEILLSGLFAMLSLTEPGLRSVLFWVVTQEIQKESLSFWISWPLKIGSIGCPETSVRIFFTITRLLRTQKSKKVKATPITGPEGSSRLSLSAFKTIGT